jgi:hypothetical protein
MKTCIMCKHWSFDSGEPGYSSWTPGSDFSTYCNKERWEVYNGSSLTQDGYRHLLMYAETCADFDQVVLE